MQFYKTIAFAGMLLAAIMPGGAQAQSAGSEPVRLIVPFAPGGAVDQLARVMSGPLGERLGRPVVVENKPGASGAIAAADVARAKPDGRTLMLALDSHAINHHLVRTLPFDTFESFDYVSLLVTLPQVLVVRKGIPAASVPQLVSWLRQHPGSAYGSAGTGSAGHVNSAALLLENDLQNTHVPYKGAGPLITDLLGGHIDFAFAGLSVVLPHIKSGALEAIALSSGARSPLLPDVPTMAESIPDFSMPTWIGLVTPAGLDEATRDRLLDAVRHALERDEVRKNLEDSGFQIVAGAPEDFLARAKKDDDVMADLVRREVVTFQ